jgi:hypothetical protein
MKNAAEMLKHPGRQSSKVCSDGKNSEWLAEAQGN